MMTVQWLRILDDGRLESIDHDTALQLWKRERAPCWVDVASYDSTELDEWLRQVGIADAAREYCLRMGEVPRVVPLQDAIFFEFPAHRAGVDSEVTTLGFLCQDALVVTLHREPVSALATVAKGVRGGRAPGRTARGELTAALVATILLALSAENLNFAVSSKASVYALDGRMDRAPDDVAAGDILAAKRQLRGLDTVVDEQKAIFGLLRLLTASYLDLHAFAEPFDAVERNASFAERAIDRMEKHLSDLQLRYDATRQEVTNRRLAMLTVVSAIFLPLTLFTGIYGMNFDVMPELHSPYAYPAALGAMAVIAGGLFWYFRSRGWLD